MRIVHDNSRIDNAVDQHTDTSHFDLTFTLQTMNTNTSTYTNTITMTLHFDFECSSPLYREFLPSTHLRVNRRSKLLESPRRRCLGHRSGRRNLNRARCKRKNIR